jgi:hypothetical protein
VEKALQFYANKDNYKPRDFVDIGVGEQSVPGTEAVLEDEGCLAREALAERELSAKREGFVFPAHKCELSLTHNAHLNSYQHVCAWIDDIDIGDDEWAAPGEKDKAIATNELWCLQWYPDTPVGFHRMFASTLDVLLAAATKEGQ